ncbi:hypothetical protein JI752_004995 [Lysobacter sp. MMG2]|uniref:hypothetical protein n=1 Tax=Lysobacter sp. MMG2 TaxID=2801338 RepID=UPI001C2169F5|nr:hypothetical protein [Lysobacter sp. MMG2]MBU8975491.1 hypothetical protein [Lysobacter sp. MMG2]
MEVALSQLQLDVENPRFGGKVDRVRSQDEVLEHIVDTFGVDDLLSSLSVNGYFEAEPLVVRKVGNELIVAEGNRRLAACLMLTGDNRARRVDDKAEKFRVEWEKHGRPRLDPVPVIVFEGEDAKRGLLSYLGVRHISASRSWDSFAKAAWVADVVEQHGLPVADIAIMIGDQHKTIERLLQGYYLIRQLIDSGDFRPNDSIRGGRGSVTDYPFSWVYTMLGYEATKRYLGLEGVATAPEPLSEDGRRKGAVLMSAMFGDRKTGRNSSVDDSRQLGRLASLLVNPETLTMVEQGKTVEEIEAATQPINDKLRLGIEQVRAALRDMTSRMDETQIEREIAAALIGPASAVSSLSASLLRKLQEAAVGANQNAP